MANWALDFTGASKDEIAGFQTVLDLVRPDQYRVVGKRPYSVEIWLVFDNQLQHQVIFKQDTGDGAKEFVVSERLKRVDADMTFFSEVLGVLSVKTSDVRKVTYVIQKRVGDCDLKDLHERFGPVTDIEALEIAIAVTQGLQQVREAGIVHGDLHAANVRVELTYFGEERYLLPFIIDFGGAYILEDLPTSELDQLLLDINLPDLPYLDFLAAIEILYFALVLERRSDSLVRQLGGVYAFRKAFEYGHIVNKIGLKPITFSWEDLRLGDPNQRVLDLLFKCSCADPSITNLDRFLEELQKTKTLIEIEQSD